MIDVSAITHTKSLTRKNNATGKTGVKRQQSIIFLSVAMASCSVLMMMLFVFIFKQINEFQIHQKLFRKKKLTFNYAVSKRTQLFN